MIYVRRGALASDNAAPAVLRIQGDRDCELGLLEKQCSIPMMSAAQDPHNV